MGMATAPAATILPTFCSTRPPSTLFSSVVPLPAIASRASIQILQQPQPPSLPSLNFPLLRNSSLVASEDSLRVAEALQEAVAVTLAGTTACAVRDAASSVQVLHDITPRDADGIFNPDGVRDEIQPASCHHKVSVGDRRRWRKARQRKRKYSEIKNDASSHTRSRFPQNCEAKPTHSGGYLTPTEEAEFSFYLKEWARIEAEMKKLCKMSEDDADPLRSAVPKESLLGRRNAERILLKAKECQERIILSYKRLVVSIATPYEGKGLSLQDLIQVVTTHANSLVAQIHPSRNPGTDEIL